MLFNQQTTLGMATSSTSKPQKNRDWKEFWALMPGIGIVGIHLLLFMGLSASGVFAFGLNPWLTQILSWILWDPKLLLFPLHVIFTPISGLILSLIKGDIQGIKSLLKSTLATLSLTHLLKICVGRLRPNAANHLSFPSGHTSSAFSGAAYFHHRYGLMAGIPAYLVASMVGVVRVYKRAHHPTDVLAGAALAVLNSYALVKQRSSTGSVAPTRPASKGPQKKAAPS